MNPGRELDALVAEKVMGYVLKAVNSCSCWVNACEKHGTFPHYSTDIAAAWRIVDKLGNDFSMHMSSRGRMTEVNFVHWPDNLKGFVFSSGLTAPHAICLAALKAVRVEV